MSISWNNKVHVSEWNSMGRVHAIVYTSTKEDSGTTVSIVDEYIYIYIAHVVNYNMLFEAAWLLSTYWKKTYQISTNFCSKYATCKLRQYITPKKWAQNKAPLFGVPIKGLFL